MRSLLGSLIVVLGLSVTVIGCDLFSTREPEPPNTGSNFIWTPATSIDYLIADFTGALQAIDASNYSRAFVQPSDSLIGGTQSYSFVVAPGLDESQKSLFVGWNVESERAYVSRLKSLLPKASKLTVLLTNRVVDQSSNAAALSADYTISIPVDGTTSVIPSVVTGSFQMQLALATSEQGTKEWRIVSWTDFPAQSGGASATWSALKAKLSS
jgi:hypothetical protein